MNGNTEKKNKRQEAVVEYLRGFFRDENLVFHHRVLISSPMSRQGGGTSAEYKGKWGEGIIVDVPYWGEKTNRQHYRYYFIRRDKPGKEWNRPAEVPDKLYQLY